MSDLEGTIAVVTEASLGGGRGISLVLGKAAATVYVTGRSVRGGPTTDNLPGTVEDTAEQVTARGGVGIPVRCDHAVDAEVEALFDRVKQEHGRLDILVNSQGIVHLEPTTEFDTDAWQRVIDTNLKSLFLCCKHVGRVMLSQGKGKIINIPRCGAFRGGPGIPPMLPVRVG